MNSDSNQLEKQENLLPDNNNPDVSHLSFLPNVLGMKSQSSINSEINVLFHRFFFYFILILKKSTLTIRKNMVNEILRILDKTMIFTIIFIIIHLIKIICSSIVLYFLDGQYYSEQAWLVLVLFLSQNALEVGYLMTKLVQTLGKQKIVLEMYFGGKEINFNPYEPSPNDKILEYFYYSTMMYEFFFLISLKSKKKNRYYSALFLWGNVVFWENQNTSPNDLICD